MEKGRVIVFNESMGRGFILTDNSKSYYMFHADDCIGAIEDGDVVTFRERHIREAFEVGRYDEKEFSQSNS